MEWRDVPGYPGYQVSERGRLRKSSGYELGRRGTRYVLSRGGVLVRLTPRELIALAWPPEPKPAPEPEPVTAAPAPEHMEKEVKAIPEGFVPLPGLDGYYINRAGECIGRKGRPLHLVRRNGPSGPYYYIADSLRSVRRLLLLAFGEGAATAAGYAEPKPIAPEMLPRGGIRQYGHGTKRRCHDCGRPTNDYRCPKCWARLRGSTEAEESEWNAL
ncbi:MAG: hypothetical protein HDR50_04830 [Desulfovibrio sp.]|uniref:NUMOD4 domain-containing protein n=1 Tax=Desulfovibrio sp. TaxID=885 RepID=UPI001A774E66|nr:NUMOD4 domain-containing protein [Desulfovibrio sp.]MBD5416980.1 hypothetical protein [Desulfovibrio sp.]